MSDMLRGLPDGMRLPHESNAQFVITPYFSHMSVYDRARSESEQKPVYELREVVQLRLAGDRNYSPVLPVDGMSHMDSYGRVVTYAERWSDQYRAFINGDAQKAGGTALEMLRDFGITPAQISLCRALNVHSIEALQSLPQDKVKTLGLSGNALKAMARKYGEAQTRRVSDDIEVLKKRIAELEGSKIVGAEQASSDAVDEAIQAADDEFESKSDDELRAYIKDATGAGVRGQPSRETLLNMAREV